MIASIKNLNLPIHDIQLIEKEWNCTISRNPMNGWWYIATANAEDMPYIRSWIWTLKAGQWPTTTRSYP